MLTKAPTYAGKSDNVAAPPKAGTAAWFHENVKRGRSEIFTVIGQLTPAIATELLKNNDANRPISPREVNKYARDIAEGRWQFNGETIIIAKDGHANDGQHRATAVLQANKSIPVLFVFGVERTSRETLDLGRSRTAGDILSMQGTKNAMVRAAIARAIIQWEYGEGKTLSPNRSATISEVVARADRDDEVDRATGFAVRNQRTGGYLAGSVAGLMHILLTRIDVNAAETFLTQVLFGENIKRGDPVYVLREKLPTLSNAAGPRVAATIRAWNFERRGAKLTGPSRLQSILPFPPIRISATDAGGEAEPEGQEEMDV
jgi:hypothetical protein